MADPQALVAIVLILVAVYALRDSIGETTLLMLVVLIPSVILHEISHGVVALACGDTTAKDSGRLTLNPIKHVDVVGTLIMPTVLILSGLGPFGYAKPVPVNPNRLRHPRNQMVLVSLVGPFTNLLLSAISVVLLRFILQASVTDNIFVYGLSGPVSVFDRLVFLLGIVNIGLAVFNALPIPPLDGSVVVERLLPASALPTWWQFRRYSMLILIFLVLIDPGGILSRVEGNLINSWAQLLIR